MVELKGKKSKTLIALVGPTAVGKTNMSIKIAQHYKCPIVSTDSRQFYSEMTIGTAKPTESELAAAEHHFINSRSIEDFYTAGMFEDDAINKLNEIYSTHDVCVAVGGSGLYVNALCYGIDDIPSDEKIRQKLIQRWQVEGLEPLQKELREIDPAYYEIADIKNSRRVIRALEVHAVTGKTYSSYRNMSKKDRSFNIIWIGLEEELDQLYESINTRVDKMMEDGLLSEVQSLMPYKDSKAMNSVGYQELIDHLEGNIDEKRAVELIKRNSRRFAKRQFTWFRKNEEVKWFKKSDTEGIISYIDANK